MSLDMDSLAELGEEIVRSLKRIAGEMDKALVTNKVDLWIGLSFLDDLMKYRYVRRAKAEARHCETLLAELRRRTSGIEHRGPEVAVEVPFGLAVTDVLDINPLGEYFTGNNLERSRRSAHIGISRVRRLLRAVREAQEASVPG